MKEYIKATTIIKHILNFDINLQVGKLLILALALKKKLIKVFFKDKAI